MIDLTPEKQHPLSQYVIAVLIVWAVILAGVWVFDRERFATFAHVCGGVLLGMCAMYIAMHLYRWKEGSEAKRSCAGRRVARANEVMERHVRKKNGGALGGTSVPHQAVALVVA